VAQVVLPVLMRWVVTHKVVYDLPRYARLCRGNQKGKFITVYTGSSSTAQMILDEIDPILCTLRLTGGYQTTTRDSGHAGEELPMGKCGIIFVRYCDSDDD